MPRLSHRILAVAALCAGVLPVHGNDFATVRTLLSEATRGGRYVTPTADELRRAEVLFLRLARGSRPDEVAGEARALALDVRAEGPLVIVRERDDAKWGRGFFIFRRAARPDVLQVPHGGTDKLTEKIGMALFTEGSFAAAVWNTVSRHDVDVAHVPNTWFSAFTRATAQAWPRGRSIQIHGFELAKRKSAAGAAADIILSNGTRSPPQELREQSACLASRLNRRVVLYPDVREIGGTTNVQGQRLRSLDYGGFVHVEMSMATRNAMRDDATFRAGFLSCLQP